jgi:hypothetical protein
VGSKENSPKDGTGASRYEIFLANDLRLTINTPLEKKSGDFCATTPPSRHGVFFVCVCVLRQLFIFLFSFDVFSLLISDWKLHMESVSSVTTCLHTLEDILIFCLYYAKSPFSNLFTFASLLAAFGREGFLSPLAFLYFYCDSILTFLRPDSHPAAMQRNRFPSSLTQWWLSVPAGSHRCTYSLASRLEDFLFGMETWSEREPWEMKIWEEKIPCFGSVCFFLIFIYQMPLAKWKFWGDWYNARGKLMDLYSSEGRKIIGINSELEK